MKTLGKEAAPAVQASTPRPGPKGGNPMAKSIIAHPAQEPTSKEKTASYFGCGQRFPRRELREVGSEEASWSLTVREGQKLCWKCARAHGVL
jgi:hypothetical protein